jgi:hypothetical protein
MGSCFVVVCSQLALEGAAQRYTTTLIDFSALSTSLVLRGLLAFYIAFEDAAWQHLSRDRVVVNALALV